MAVTTVFCRTRFIAFHYWKDAPAAFHYLSVPHRHEFHVEVHVQVNHANREVEFQYLRKIVDYYLASEYTAAQKPEGAVPLSCEMIAERIADMLEQGGYEPVAVTVSEDGENGATFTL